MGGAVRRYWTSSLLRMWEDWFRLMKAWGASAEVSEWELRERRERGEERRAEADELGAVRELSAREGLPLFLPTPSFMASIGDS